jgi:hypothetical protein
VGYEVHITRRNPAGKVRPIALAEWRAVVERTAGVRMADGDFEAVNPKTAEVIRIQNVDGDVEVFFPADGTWRRLFRWSRSGRISFRAPDDFDGPASAIRCLACELARGLKASLIGDEGEIYDC